VAMREMARLGAASIREIGLRETIRSVPMFLRAAWIDWWDGFDRTYGTDTASHVAASQLRPIGANAGEAVMYWPTRPAAFRALLSPLRALLHDLVFVDLGSGKGRAVLMASELPFRRIIGVEFSADLHAIARTNLALHPPAARRCRSIDLLHMDAVDFEPPPDPTVFYLFHPFGPAVLRRVLENIDASLRRWPRDLYLVYLNPRLHELVLTSGFRPMAGGEADGRGQFDWTVYHRAQDRTGTRAGTRGAEGPTGRRSCPG
jgi:SAM-dependent methyltransferase